MKYQLYTDMALARDLPAHDLRRGDVVRLVEHHVGPNGDGYSIEVLSAVGETVAVTTVDEASLEPLHSDEVLSVRRIRSAA
jgi:hypothetical protein